MTSAKLLSEIYPLISHKFLYFDINTSTYNYLELRYLGSTIGKKIQIVFYDLKISLPKNNGNVIVLSYRRNNLPYCDIETEDNSYEFESLELKLTRLSPTKVIMEGEAIIFEEYDEDPRLPFSFVVLVDL